MPPGPRIVIAALLTVLLSVLVAGCSSSHKNGLATVGFAGAALPSGIAAPALTLTDQDGHGVSLAAYRGRVVVLSFLYSTCGGPCILIAHQIRGALDELVRPVPVLLISSDPAADSPAAVRRFLRAVSLTGRASYLSGTAKQLRAAWRAYPALSHGAGQRAARRFVGVMLIDRHGAERVAYSAEQLTPESLAHDIRKLAGG